MQLLVAVGWLAGCAAGTHRTGLQQQLRSEAEDGVLSGGVYVDTEIAGECEVNVFSLANSRSATLPQWTACACFVPNVPLHS